MKNVGISELKTRLAKYLRLVKTGEEVEIQERGVPIAILCPVQKQKKTAFIQPRKPAHEIGQMRFSVKPHKRFNVVDLLTEERKKR